MARTWRLRLAGALAVALVAVGCGSGASKPVGSADASPAKPAPAAAPVAAPGAPAVAAARSEAAPTAVGGPTPAVTAATALPTPAPSSPDRAGSSADAASVPSWMQRPITPQPAGAALRAGEVDDNARFAEYRAYLAGYRGPAVHAVNVSERYLLTVKDGQGRPVHDARVKVTVRGRQVFSGLTYANGQVPFFPLAQRALEQEQAFQVEVSRDGVTQTADLQRGGEDLTLVLDLDRRQQPPLNLDLLFLIDTTGSMGDEIAALRSALQSIVRQVDNLQPRPRLRLGMVLYRDRGDEYLTRTVDSTADVARFAAALDQVQARGGGDTPESLNEALHKALSGVSWRSQEPTLRLTFLLADAPPHLDYAQDYHYPDLMAQAVQKGVKIFPLAASGLDAQGEYIFRQLAQFTLGRFIFLTYQQGSSGAPGDRTVHNVSGYDVAQLDDLMVNLIAGEVRQQAR